MKRAPAVATIILAMYLWASAAMAADAAQYFQLGQQCFNQRRYSSAITAYKKAIRQDRNYAKAYLGLATVYGQLLHYDSAIKAARQALTPCQGDARCQGIAYELMAVGYLQKEQFDKAATFYEKAYQNRPDQTRLKTALDQVRQLAGK